MKLKGFTLIELLVVVAIIGILATIVLASLNSAQTKAQDAKRKSDLRNVAIALELYAVDNGTYCVSGGGIGGNGYGFFAYQDGGSYPISVSQQLVNEGYLPVAIEDPSGAVRNNESGRSGYMVYCNGTNYTLWANLESPSLNDTNTLSSCHFDSYDNYAGTDPASTRMNFCLSN